MLKGIHIMFITYSARPNSVTPAASRQEIISELASLMKNISNRPGQLRENHKIPLLSDIIVKNLTPKLLSNETLWFTAVNELKK